MSLNNDNPVIKSYIDAAQQDLKTTVDNISSRILQVCQSCASALECYEKVPAQADDIPGDFKTLTDTLLTLFYTTEEQNTSDSAALMSVSEAIGVHCKTTLVTMLLSPKEIAQAIYVTSDTENGYHIYPNNLKTYIDNYFSPVNGASQIFFDWLRNQPMRA
ncbi:hypothetical protein AAB988_16495 [Burkholderia contaminans]|uniref:hypothetical protein n=1 Tax=Burkholderia contaminans TaxID=488447 RepID=UPI003115C6B9